MLAGLVILVLEVPESPPDASAMGAMVAMVSSGTMTAIRRLSIGSTRAGSARSADRLRTRLRLRVRAAHARRADRPDTRGGPGRLPGDRGAAQRRPPPLQRHDRDPPLPATRARARNPQRPIDPRPRRTATGHRSTSRALRRQPPNPPREQRRVRRAGPIAARGGSPGMSIDVLIADDQALVRAGFRMILEANQNLRVVAEANDGAAAVEATRRTRPDVVLMDIRGDLLRDVELRRFPEHPAGRDQSRAPYAAQRPDRNSGPPDTH